jgi:large subunit ribosomal protein L25
MNESELKATKRDVIGKKVKVLRREGYLPAIIYGRGVESIPITLNRKEADKILAKTTSSQLLVIEVDGKKHTTLVRDRQRHPVTSDILHIDFLEVSMTEKLRTMVDVILTGESLAVKELGAILVTGVEAIEIECLPSDLPENFVIDISSLEDFGDAVYVRDIKIGDGIEVLTDLDELVAVSTAPAAEVEEEEVEEEEMELGEEEPEVIEKGKKEEEGEEEEE